MQNDPRDRSPKKGAQLVKWLKKLAVDRNRQGYVKFLGTQHAAVFSSASPTLLVTFETLESILDDRDDELPLGQELAKQNGWSHLGVIADGNSWFRNKSVYSFFDDLIDECFFDDFDQVVFMGEGMCGYAAAAYSVAAPDCTVLLFSPQATLDPRIAIWDHRFIRKRRLSFNDRYGYAPEMIEAANKVYLFYDPESDMEAMHAALFTRPHVTKLRCRWLGQFIADDFAQMGILEDLVKTAGENGDVAQEFYRLYRARHDYLPYLRRLLKHLTDEDRCMLSGILCRNVIGRFDAPRIQRQLEKIEAKMKADGRTLPRKKIRKKFDSPPFPPLA